MISRKRRLHEIIEIKNEITLTILLKSHTWRGISSGTSKKLLNYGARGRLRQRQWSEVIAARKQRKSLRKLLTHRGNAIVITRKYFWYWTHCEYKQKI